MADSSPNPVKFLHGPNYSELQNIVGEYSPVQSAFLQNRYSESESCTVFNTTLRYIHPPFHLPDFRESILLIDQMVEEGKKILLFGDRDCDGVSSTALLARSIKTLHPDRGFTLLSKTSAMNDDYGLCRTVMEKIFRIHPDLLITLDFGTSNIQEIIQLNEAGIKNIIIDHHEPSSEKPECLFINPRRADSVYPEKKICTSVLSLKVACGLFLIKKFKRNFILINSIKALNDLYYKLLERDEEFRNFFLTLLDLASIGTISDLMPLWGENRAIVSNGCKILSRYNKSSPSIGLHMIVNNLRSEKETISAKDIGWSIAPLINSAGRMGDSEVAMKLLLTDSESEAKEYYNMLLEFNQNRKNRTQKNIRLVEDYFNKFPEKTQKKILFCYTSEMEPGVSGIVATKIAEEYKKTAIFITPENENARGSVRAFGNFNVLDILQKVSEFFLHYGGHPEAAGFSILKEKIPELELKLNELMETGDQITNPINPKVSDLCIFPDSPLIQISKDLKKFEPFGQLNPEPLYSIQEAIIVHCKTMGNDKHVKFNVLGMDPAIWFIIWNRSNDFFNLSSLKSKIDLWGVFEEKTYKGKPQFQFIIRHFE